MNCPVLLADFVFWDIVHAWTSSSGARFEALITFGAIFLVSLLAFLIAILTSRHRKRRRRHHHRQRDYSSESRPPERSGETSFRRRRRRRDRDQSLPLNPTLAETGGLPPPRPEDEPPPPYP